jgi:hypothetical protein
VGQSVMFVSAPQICVRSPMALSCSAGFHQRLRFRSYL